MKILKSAICFLLLFSIHSSNGEDYDLKKITTTTGKVYRNIEFLDADEHGLLFRHERGIAKENYSSLSENFQPVKDAPKPPEPKGQDPKAQDQAANGAMPDLVLTFAIRQSVVAQPYYNPCYQAAYYHPYHPNPVSWPNHWHRFHNAHYLTNPHYRALATRNFLYDTGLIYPFGRMHYQYR